LLRVTRPQPEHLYWPELDVDLSVESIEHPERFPLIARPTPPPRRIPSVRRPRARSAASP
jgi:hypothetical protein